MIVITGAPRTGTSLMMQTLKILGFPIVGNMFNDFNLEEHNKKGYFELDPLEVSQGIIDNKYNGKAIKLFGQGLLKTRECLIKKLIVCKRDQEASANSFLKLLENSPKSPVEANERNAKILVKWNADVASKFSSVCECPVLNVWYHDMIDSPEITVKRIVKFLDIKPSKYRIKKAIENIDRG